MARYQGKTGRLITGGKIKTSKGKKKRELGRPAAQTQIAEIRKKAIRIHGGRRKYRLYRTLQANVMDPKTGKAIQTKVQDVSTNPASRDFSRRRVITKGAILATEAGQAMVTNRPGIEGHINAILLEE